MPILLPRPGAFPGFPGLRPAVLPPVRAVLVNGKIMKPVSGIDWLLFGVVSAVRGERLFPLNARGLSVVPTVSSSTLTKKSMPRNAVAGATGVLTPMRKRKLKYGQWFRNTDTLGCIARIKEATTRDIEELQAAWSLERSTKRRRKKLCAFLQKRITQLFAETAVRRAA